MRVVTMALMDMFCCLLIIVASVLALLSRYWFWVAYVNAFLLLLMFIIIVLSIPLKLNWSRNLYGDLVNKIIGFICFSIVIYSVHYYFIGIQDSNGKINNSFLNSIYFSITTWTTLGYGDFAPTPRVRLLTSLEALTGLITIPITVAVVWLYCQERLWKKSMDQIGTKKRKRNLQLELDDTTGVFKEMDSAKTKKEKIERKNKFRLNSCSKCKNKNIEIEKYYEILGVATPLPQFSVFCKCGNRTRGHISAFRAAWEWNRRNR